MNERNNVNPDDLEKNETTEKLKARDLTAEENSEAEAYFNAHLQPLLDIKDVEAARNRFAHNIENLINAGMTLSEAIEASEQSVIKDYKSETAYTGSHKYNINEGGNVETKE